MNGITRRAAACLCVLLASSVQANCLPVQGVVTLTPDPACRVVGALGSWQSGEAPDPLLAMFPGADPASVCFAVSGTGTAQFSGFSGLTAVPVAGFDGNFTATPLVYLAAPTSARAGLSSFTAQGVLSGRIRFGGINKSGTLFTKDTGVFGSDGKAAELIKIVGGTGDFQGASGTIAVAGQELGGYAVFTGSICTAN